METNLSIYTFIKKYNPHFKKFEALNFHNHKITFQDFCFKVEQFASCLKGFGIKKKDVVTIVLPNILEAIIVFYALAKIGVISDMIHPLTSIKKIRDYMKITKSKYIISIPQIINPEEFIEQYIFVDQYYCTNKLLSLKNVRKYKTIKNKLTYGKDNHYYNDDANGEDILCYLHSSGTEGEEKTVVLCHQAFNYVSFQIEKLFNNVSNKNSSYAILPLFHGYSLCTSIHFCLTFGIRIVLDVRFKPKRLLKQFKKFKINFFFGVPFIYDKLVKSRYFKAKYLKHVVQCYSGSEKISDDLLVFYEKFFKDNNIDACLLQGYGLTETVTACVANTKLENKLGSCGKPLFENTIAVFDGCKLSFKDAEGEVYVASKGLMQGYLNEANQPFVDIENKRYLKTGDYGYIDSDGYLYFKQRIKNIIIRKGINIFPFEVEKVIKEIEEVEEAVLIENNKKTPADICLFVKVKNDFIDYTQLKCLIIERVKSSIGILSLPQKIYIIDIIPYNKTGKIIRHILNQNIDNYIEI